MSKDETHDTTSSDFSLDALNKQYNQILIGNPEKKELAASLEVQKELKAIYDRQQQIKNAAKEFKGKCAEYHLEIGYDEKSTQKAAELIFQGTDKLMPTPNYTNPIVEHTKDKYIQEHGEGSWEYGIRDKVYLPQNFTNKQSAKEIVKTCEEDTEKTLKNVSEQAIKTLKTIEKNAKNANAVLPKWDEFKTKVLNRFLEKFSFKGEYFKTKKELLGLDKANSIVDTLKNDTSLKSFSTTLRNIQTNTVEKSK